ncbi:hypothetical protein JXM67_15470 [candidate division WOR-3 bacterium]|nr:hypothetical protein [candidate division WOR-3 bacterium]
MWGEELTINLFGMTLLGSVIVAAIVAKLKVWLGTKGWLNTLLALIVGTALGALTYLAELLFLKLGVIGQAMPLVVALVQGLFSGGIAAGLWKAARSLNKKG